MGMVMGMVMEHMAKVTQVVGRVNIRTIRMGTTATLITDIQDMIIRMGQTAITTVASCIRYLNLLHNTVADIIDNVIELIKSIFIFYAMNAK